MAWREKERFSAYINSEPEKKAYYENELQTTIDNNAGMGGAAAGVSPADSDAGLSGESEKELSENN